MARRVERADEHTNLQLRAAVAVSSFAHAVEELVLNSLDAGASSIDVRVDFECYRFTVSDNGRGIPRDELRDLIATAHATSKARSFADVSMAATHGCRGEALHSLALTSLVEVQSRCRAAPGAGAFSKVVRAGQALSFGGSATPAWPGTTVVVRDAFFKWPVRRKAMGAAAQTSRAREAVQAIALAHPHVEFRLTDASRGRTLLDLRRAPAGLPARLTQLFGEEKAAALHEVAHEHGGFRLAGYLSPPSTSACHWSRELQFVYLNGRWIRRLDFVHRAVNSAYAKCFNLLTATRRWPDRGGGDAAAAAAAVGADNDGDGGSGFRILGGGGGGGRQQRGTGDTSSGKRSEQYALFVLRLECAPDRCDVLVEPDKASVEFDDWLAARACVAGLLTGFLARFPHAVPDGVRSELRAQMEPDGRAAGAAAAAAAAASRNAAALAGDGRRGDSFVAGNGRSGGSLLEALRDRRRLVRAPSVAGAGADGQRVSGSPGGEDAVALAEVGSPELLGVDLSSPAADSPYFNAGAAAAAATVALRTCSGRFRGDQERDLDRSPSPPQEVIGLTAAGVAAAAVGAAAAAAMVTASDASGRVDAEATFCRYRAYGGCEEKDLTGLDEIDAHRGSFDDGYHKQPHVPPPLPRPSADLPLAATFRVRVRRPPSPCPHPLWDEEALADGGSPDGQRFWPSPTAPAGRDPPGGQQFWPSLTAVAERDSAGSQQLWPSPTAAARKDLVGLPFGDPGRAAGPIDFGLPLQDEQGCGDGGGGDGDYGEELESADDKGLPWNQPDATIGGITAGSYDGGGRYLRDDDLPACPTLTAEFSAAETERGVRRGLLLGRYGSGSGGGGGGGGNGGGGGSGGGSGDAEGDWRCSDRGGCVGGGGYSDDGGVAAAAAVMAADGLAPSDCGSPLRPKNMHDGGDTPPARVRIDRDVPPEARGGEATGMEMSEAVRAPMPEMAAAAPLTHGEDKSEEEGDAWAAFTRKRRADCGSGSGGGGGSGNSGSSWKRTRPLWLLPEAAGGGSSSQPLSTGRNGGNDDARVWPPSSAAAASSVNGSEEADRARGSRSMHEDGDSPLWARAPGGFAAAVAVAAAGANRAGNGSVNSRLWAADSADDGVVGDAAFDFDETALGDSPPKRNCAPDSASVRGESPSRRDGGLRARSPSLSPCMDRMLVRDRGGGDGGGGGGGSGRGEDGSRYRDTSDIRREAALPSAHAAAAEASSWPDDDDAEADGVGADTLSLPLLEGESSEKDGCDGDDDDDGAIGDESPAPGEVPILGSGRSGASAGAPAWKGGAAAAVATGCVPMTLSAAALARAAVIGQADNKFVLLRAGGVVLCLDQHAADERVRLEALERRVYGARRDERNVDVLSLRPPEVLRATLGDAELLRAHRALLEAWRFAYDVAPRAEGGRVAIALEAVPVVCGVRLSRSDLLGLVHHLGRVCAGSGDGRGYEGGGGCGGGGRFGDDSGYGGSDGLAAAWVRPPQVQHVLCYKACHSAIRFGDALSPERCRQLVADLSACSLPFQCAHGRPSVAPLCTLAPLSAGAAAAAEAGAEGAEGGGCSVAMAVPQRPRPQLRRFAAARLRPRGGAEESQDAL